MRVHLLTGDEPAVAHRVAADLGIGRVRSRATSSLVAVANAMRLRGRR
jgi:magnesium-transporting ATPase (P-type)